MWKRSNPPNICCSLAVAVFLMSPLMAHGAIHGQIRAVTAMIRHDLGNASLYLKRGELHRLHHEWAAAGRDYDRAQQLNPGLALVRLARGKMLWEAGKPARARSELDRFLAAVPDHRDGILTRARVLKALRRYPESVSDYARAIERNAVPDPGEYLERAQVQALRGRDHLPAAIAGLDEGLRRLGPVVMLQTFAIDLETRRGAYDAALERLGPIIAQAERKESWLARRGEILLSAGRRAEAEEAFRAALSAIEKLPRGRRAAPATTAIEKQVRGRIATLERNGS